VRTVGLVTTILVALGLVAVLGLVVISIPDLARYLRLRRM
jgi:uncharacterized protein YjeT (DUF2065 family)